MSKQDPKSPAKGTDKAGRGRPASLHQGKRVNIYLDAASLAKAEALGDGNASKGVRIALEKA